MQSRPPRLCYITARSALEPRPILPVIRGAIEAGIDLIQIREKDLPTLELLGLAEAVVEAARDAVQGGGATVWEGTRIVVNDRLDVALAAGAHGVHLGGKSMLVEQVRSATSALESGFWVGSSCHSAAEVLAAETAGADYVVIGPVFETPSKVGYGPPLGLGVLREAARQSRVPLLALGGISPERVRSCLEAGATGIAGISIFQDCSCVSERVRELKKEIEEFEGARKQ